MSRPVDADSARTWNAIVAAARAVLEEQGVRAVNLRRVASRARVSVGTIGYYFENRSALLEACLESYYEHLDAIRSESFAALTGCARPEDAVRLAVERATELSFAHRGFARLRRWLNAQTGTGAPRKDAVLLPFLGQLEAGLAAISALEGWEIRLAAQTITYAMTTYATLTDEELCEVVGAASIADARERVKRHLARAALDMLHLNERGSV